MGTVELPELDAMLTELGSREGGDTAVALRALTERLRRARAAVSIWQRVAARLLANGDAVTAEGLIEQGLLAHPGESGLRYLLGNAMRIQGRHAAAEHELRAVLAAEPGHPDAALSLAYLLRERGRLSDAVTVMLARWHFVRGEPEEARRTATFVAQCNHHSEALHVCTQALEDHPDARVLALRGSLALTLGQFGRAAIDLRLAVDMDPTQATAWLWLALARKFQTHDDPDLAALEAVAAAQPVGSAVHICAGFALGKAYDDLEDFSAAVRVLREANAAMVTRTGWQTREWEDFVARQINEVPPEALAVSDFTPVFVVGMPRTGTTLAATLLDRHPQVRNRGELGWLAAASEQGAPQHYPRGFLTRVAELYSAQLRQDDEPVRCYLDKNPFNFRYLGVAAALFPQARVIHCRRDQRDTALSIWRQHFGNAENGYAYRFSDIAAVVRGHDRLMKHWQAVLSLPIYELDYETLVARPDEAIEDVLRFLGLDSRARMVDAAPGCQAIGTASLWQARQPIYKTSVGRWRSYAPYLPELELFESTD